MAETKALIQLLCIDADRDEIDAFAIDCFNDVTGMNSLSTALFDVQSKATSDVPVIEFFAGLEGSAPGNFGKAKANSLEER